MARVLFLLPLLAAPLFGKDAAVQPNAKGPGVPMARPAEVGLSAKALERIDAAMQSFVGRKRVAGIVTLIARKGRVAHFKAYGFREIEGAKPMRRDTIFRIYSMTKPVTSVAAMILVQEGKLGLDDPVSKHVPAFKALRVYGDGAEGTPLKRAMTVRDLLRHTAGFTYGFGNSPVDRMVRKQGLLGSSTVAEMIQKLSALPLAHQPQTKWHYSVATDVLGHVVEVASKQTLDAFFREKIFKPLDMRDTGFHTPASKHDRFAANYRPKIGGGLHVIDKPATGRFSRPRTFLSGGGGLVSTARDYWRFCQMLLNGGTLDGKRVLKTASVEAMTRNQLPEALTPIGFGPLKMPGTGFGLGFAVRVKELKGEPKETLGEYGWGGAATTRFHVAPNADLICISMTQVMPMANQIHEAVRKIGYEAVAQGADKPEEIAPPAGGG